MAADNDLGDLIVEIKLDDAKYRADVKQALTVTQTEVRKASAQSQAALKKGFDAREATQSLKALHGTLYLLTGETGFFVITAGQAAVNIGKFATATGGLTAALAGSSAAMKGFLAAIGPVGIALLGAGAAYATFSHFIDKDLKKAEVRAAKLMAQLPAMELAEKAARENALARGDITPRENRIAELLGTDGMTKAKAERIAAQEESTAALKAAKQQEIEDEKAIQERLTEIRKTYWEQEQQEMDRRLAAIQEAKRREMQAAVGAEQELQNRLSQMRQHDEAQLEKSIARKMAQFDAIFEFKTRHGLAAPSDRITDPVLKMMAQFDEQRVAMRNAATGDTEPGFGIGSQDSNAFRFGPGAFGSVIGQQTEQAKTNDYLKSIDEETKAQAANIAIIARAMTTGDTSSLSNLIPLPGL